MPLINWNCGGIYQDRSISDMTPHHGMDYLLNTGEGSSVSCTCVIRVIFLKHCYENNYAYEYFLVKRFRALNEFSIHFYNLHELNCVNSSIQTWIIEIIRENYRADTFFLKKGQATFNLIPSITLVTNTICHFFQTVNLEKTGQIYPKDRPFTKIIHGFISAS